MKNSQQALTPYLKSVDNALRFIEDHLHGKLSLEQIASVGHYSSFHFHRIFKTVVGETLHQYVQRKRIERCAGLLLHRDQDSIQSVYLEYNFSNASIFSKAFKKYYGLSPARFRESVTSRNSKIRQVKSKNGQPHLVVEKYICSMKEHLNWLEMNAQVEVITAPKRHLMTIASIGLENIGTAYDQLIGWATPKGLMDQQNLRLLTIYHDSAKTTAMDRVRVSACLQVPAALENDGLIKYKLHDPGKCIKATLSIGMEEFEQAWKSFYIWMHENGYRPSTELPFEVYLNNYQEHPEKKCEVELHIPVM